MTKQPKIIKRQDKPDKPTDPDVWRMAVAFNSVLKRRYPDPSERAVVERKIMQKVRGNVI